MFTAAANFHHARFLGFFAVFTTELAAFFGRTITGSVCALAGYFFRHETEPPTQLAGRSVVGGCRETHARPHRREGQAHVTFNNPESQCTMFRANCRLSMPGRFMPKGMPLRAASCADSIAASPSTTARPLPRLIVMPCARPAAEVGLGLTPGITSSALSASFMKATLSAGPFSDWPVKAMILLMRSESLRPRVIA